MLRLFPLLFVPFAVSAQLNRFEFAQSKMGSPFHLVFYHNDSTEARMFAQECFRMVDSLNAIFSDYDPESEVCKLARQPIQTRLSVSDELFAVILLARYASVSSNGAFDVTIGSLTGLWRKAKAEKRFPPTEEIDRARGSAGYKNLVIQTGSKNILVARQGLRLDFGGIAKGYAAQKMVDLLRTKNITSVLADAGGDIAVGEAPPGKNGWKIAINLPQQANELMDRKLELKNGAVATSGDVFNYILHEGKKYSHIIDPRTGYGVTSRRNVTVIAKDGATADWLATACSILPVKQALALANKENAALLIAMIKEENIVTYKTKNFDSYLQEKLP